MLYNLMVIRKLLWINWFSKYPTSVFLLKLIKNEEQQLFIPRQTSRSSSSSGASIQHPCPILGVGVSPFRTLFVLRNGIDDIRRKRRRIGRQSTDKLDLLLNSIIIVIVIVIIVI
uniref:Uncharacterized protein n=1 Tax=Opuntia streptacantha TaxID=393608 RepID=A0A7C9EV70_OPUST